MENSDDYLSVDQIACHVGAKVKVSGLVDEIEDHGGLLFIDLNDRGSLIRALVIPDDENVYAMSKKARKGYLVEIEGIVKECPISAQDFSLGKSKIEIEVKKITIISARSEEENRLKNILARINDDNIDKKII